MSRRLKKMATKSTEITQVTDLLLEIFLRLPLHSIHRFKSTCKHWNSLLSDPSFRKLWRKRNLKPSTGLFLRTKNPVFVPLSHCSVTPTLPKHKINQSCNGLLLCSFGKTYFVYNPTTNVYCLLPKLSRSVMKADGARILSISLAFDPIRFGNCYIVVCCVTSKEYSLRVHVYSSDIGRWKSLYKDIVGSVNSKGVYWNGAIHWLRELSYFDIGKEEFKVMARPQGCGNWRIHYYLGVSCDRLTYVKLIWEPRFYDLCSAHVYELKRDYSEWVLKYRVGLDLGFDISVVLSVVHGLEEEDSFLVLKTKEEGLVRFNLVSKTSEKLPFALTGGYIDCAFQYIETRCSV